MAAAVFALYRATLLPGFDFGDSASFQFRVGSPIITPRDGYPLYYLIGRVFLYLTGADPAHALNVGSAVEGALACGVLTLAAARLSGSLVAGTGSALLFAGSYTFWSQSIIAEVYALHMLCVALTVWLILRWEEQPTLGRLSLFFAVYGVACGNHLSMILFLPAFVAFLLVSAPGGWRSMLAPRVCLLAFGFAVAGATQYAWNLRGLWLGPFPPTGLFEALHVAWVDITKADWRETLVLHVPRALLGDRLSMYRFDVLQQFGATGVVVAVIGLWRMVATNWRRAMLMTIAYLANVGFAFGYNVGDTHVFYLPSHLVIAMIAAPGSVFIGRLCARLPRGRTRSHGESELPQRPFVLAATLLFVAYSVVRIYDDYPALDRSGDTRPADTIAHLTDGLDDRRSILIADLSWEVSNGLAYYEKEMRSQVASARLSDVLHYAPTLANDNLDIGRDVALTARARDALAKAYGSLISTEPAPNTLAPGIRDLTANLPRGTPYVLCVLKPTREFRLDADDLTHAISSLTGAEVRTIPSADYVTIAGLVGELPLLVAADNSPFRRRLDLGGLPVSIRMESWLAADTIRRMGFGHVIAARRHVLIVERGVSFVALSRTGDQLRTGYGSSIFAPEPRYLCYR